LFKEEVIIGQWNHAAAIGLAELFRQQGDDDAAQKLLDTVTRFIRKSYYQYYYAMAAIHTLQGDFDAALDTLEASFADDNRYGWWILERDELFAPLWSDPRFEPLIGELRTDMRSRQSQVLRLQQNGQLKTIPPATWRSH
jgi:tetratricopeptide (TPR) repeat protein